MKRGEDENQWGLGSRNTSAFQCQMEAQSTWIWKDFWALFGLSENETLPWDHPRAAEELILLDQWLYMLFPEWYVCKPRIDHK